MKKIKNLLIQKLLEIEKVIVDLKVELNLLILLKRKK